jgi:hypothetical protein
MTGKAKQPGEHRAPTEEQQPGQQMADDGSQEGALNFGNIDPADGGQESGDDLGGG